MITRTEKPVLSDRVRKEKEEVLSATPRVSIERVKVLLQVWKETEGQPPVIRRARLFDRLCSEKSIFIDGNPLVGTLTEHKYGSYPMPEFRSRWMRKGDEFAFQRGLARINKDDREWIDKAVDYWGDITVFERTRQIMLKSRGVDIAVLQKCGLGTELAPGETMNTVPDFAKVLNKGFKGLLAEIEAEQAKVDTGTPEGLRKWYWYDGASICLNAMIKLAQRYASLAREMAAKEKDGRRQELLRIAQTCEWVPAHPARGFYEALQSAWFVTLGEWIETPTQLVCEPSRFTQYMYPFYKRDKEEGRLSDEEAIELIQLYFLKLNGLAQVLPPHAHAFNQSRIGLQLSLGGLTPEGEDATNELDFLVLEAQRRIRLPEPLVGLVYHDKLSEEFLLKCVDLIRTGIGQPAFHNLERAIQRHLYWDRMPLEEARTVSTVGCVQSILAGYSAFPWEGLWNISKMVELALNDGKDPLTGIQLGPHTGDAESFSSYEQLRQAVVKQMGYFVPLAREIMRTGWSINNQDFPVPFGSALTNDCIKNGKDATDGGTRYNGGNATTICGGIDLANSMAAIKRLVFEDKKVTMKQLKEALAANFEGYDEIQRTCLDAPKYGNDDDYADSIARDMYDVYWKAHQQIPDDFLGRPSKPEAFSVTGHFANGRFTGALPSGRKARTPLTDASVSAMPGTDKNGPTALVKSAARVIDTVKFGSNHLNMKFHPSALEGLENARKFLSLIRTYFDLGGYHVQFNCVRAETLKEAQLHPENYRDLVVRVAGFSAFFIHLDKAVQDEIIKRTELRFA